jgi:hypothetical protein
VAGGQQQLLHGLGIDRILGATQADYAECLPARGRDTGTGPDRYLRHVNSAGLAVPGGSWRFPFTEISTAEPLLTRMMISSLPNGSLR